MSIESVVEVQNQKEPDFVINQEFDRVNEPKDTNSIDSGALKAQYWKFDAHSGKQYFSNQPIG